MLQDKTPPFDSDVPVDGYQWWYVDGISDCRRYGLVVIAFIGSVFSPYYFRARRKGVGNPRNFCAINVASYGRGANAWSMTERNAQQLTTTPDRMQVGRSYLELSGAQLSIHIDERTMPWLRRLRGTVGIKAEHASAKTFSLDAGHRHKWQPIAPIARIEVTLDSPELAWKGDAYVDTNFGSRPLEDDFASWHWSSLRRPEGSRIYYDALQRDGQRRCIALAVNAQNEMQAMAAPAHSSMQKSGWGIERTSLHGNHSRVIETLEDAPFYARSLIAVDEEKAGAVAMHESLSLERFSRGWVRTLLPFRMPRVMS